MLQPLLPGIESLSPPKSMQKCFMTPQSRTGPPDTLQLRLRIAVTWVRPGNDGIVLLVSKGDCIAQLRTVAGAQKKAGTRCFPGEGYSCLPLRMFALLFRWWSSIVGQFPRLSAKNKRNTIIHHPGDNGRICCRMCRKGAG